jgi:hypothetical protein
MQIFNNINITGARNEEFYRLFKNYLNGYHFVDHEKLIHNSFFQSDLPFG